MSKHRNKPHRPYTGPQTRQQAKDRQNQKDLLKAQQGYIEETDEEIAEQIDQDYYDSLDDDDEESSADDQPQKWYVIDTNLLIACVDILYDEDDDDWREPIDFEPKLDNAFLIIPETVHDELDHMKDEVSRRGLNARIALGRLAKFFPNSGRTLEEIGTLRRPVKTGWKNQTIALLPLHKEFKRILPWVIKGDDNDSWIATTALAATMIHDGFPVDGSQKIDILKRSNKKDNVILLTNDNGLRSKADQFGVRAESYSFTKRPAFTGIRKVKIPAELFESYYHEDKLEAEDFETCMPQEPALVANEYIIMIPEKNKYPEGYYSTKTISPFLNIARYHAENDLLCPLRFVKHEGIMPANEGIAAYYDALNDDKIKVVIVTGAAGTGKTYQAIYHAIKELRAGRKVKAVLIPSRPAKNPLGALPGGAKEKMEPLVGAAKDAIRSYLASTPEFTRMREQLEKYGDNTRGQHDESEEDDDNRKKKKQKDSRDRKNYRNARRANNDYTLSYADLDYEDDGYASANFDEPHSKKKNKTFYPGKADKKEAGEGKVDYYEKLTKETNYLYDRYFISLPYEEAEGRSFDDCIIILDEFQRVQVDDSDTLITRPGNRSKLIICGDIDQIHDSSPEKCFNNGLNYARMLYYNEEIAAAVHLTKNMRSEVSMVATKNRYKVRRMMGLI